MLRHEGTTVVGMRSTGAPQMALSPAADRPAGRWRLVREHARKHARKFALCAVLIGRVLVPSSTASALQQQQQQRSSSVEQAAPADRTQRTLRPVGEYILSRRQQTQCAKPSTERTPPLATVTAPASPTGVQGTLKSDSDSAAASVKAGSVHYPNRMAAALASPSFSAACSKVDQFMYELEHHISTTQRDTILLLLATALVTPMMNLIGLSPVLGFLFAGMLLGPSGLAVIADVETTTKLAELGVVFFLFEMGLEL
jgi:hypothetical protein